MKVYLTYQAPNPDRVFYFLREKDALDKVEHIEISIPDLEHRQDAYKAISPLSQVPALVLDDGTSITESRAISGYLESVFPEPNLMGVDAKERAVIEMWDRRVEMLYMFAIAGWLRHGNPGMAHLEPVQLAEWADINKARAEKMATFLDKRLGESEFVAGDRFTIADITLFVTLGFGRVMKFKPWETLENIARYRKDMLARPALSAPFVAPAG